jgi:RalA-binding protein 1
VLCAESDSDRDDWVDVLVRYVMGSYNDDPAAPFGPGPAPLAVSTSTATQGGVSASQPRSSTSSIAPFDNNNVLSTPNSRKSMKVGMSKEDIVIAKGPAVPISQLAPDATNMKFFQTPQHDEIRTSSPSKDLSPTDRKESSGFSDSDHARRILEKGQPPVAEVPLSSSLPTNSPLDGPTGLVGTRANSELGHYSDMQEQRDGRHGATSPERHRPRERKVFQPTLNTVVSTPNMPAQRDQDSLQDNAHTPRVDAQGKAKISGPLGGTVIPAGYKFGGKDVPAEATPSATDRREKAKSRSFWGFGKNGEFSLHCQL